MGHRSYLYIKGKEESKDLFENNNGLSLFWLSLIEPDVFERTKEHWLAYHRRIETLPEEKFEDYLESIRGSDRFEFIIEPESINKSDSNSSKFQAYLFQSKEEGLAEFYTEFLAYVKSEIRAGDLIGVDLFSLSNFAGIPSFSDELEQAIRAISESRYEFLDNWMAINVSALSGWVCGDSSFSTFYQNLNESEKRSRSSYQKRRKVDKYEDEKYFVLFFFSVMALSIYAVMLFRSGSYVWGILSLLGALVFALFAYAFGDNSIQNWKNRK